MTQDSIEQQILVYLRLLEVYSIEEQPRQWAETQFNLGAAYLKRELGNRDENVSRAIHHLEAALHVLDRVRSPQQWANAQNTLGIAYLRRALVEPAQQLERGELGRGAEYLKQAIAHLELALSAVEREKQPEQWATTQHNLGVAFSGLGSIEGERTGNRREAFPYYERAVLHFRQALQVYTQNSYPDQWALIHNSYLDELSRILGGELVSAGLSADQPTQLAGDQTTDAPPPSTPPPDAEKQKKPKRK
jgi:tetratricopeptide (TPR) repeat protein